VAAFCDAIGRETAADRRRNAWDFAPNRVVPGGTFEGERLSGMVLEGASDWQGDPVTTKSRNFGRKPSRQ
jgi:hypothetical protein